MFISSSKLDSKCSTDSTRNCKIKIWEGEKGSDKESFLSCLSLSFIPPYPLLSLSFAALILPLFFSLLLPRHPLYYLFLFLSSTCHVHLLYSQKLNLEKKRTWWRKIWTFFSTKQRARREKYCYELFSLLKFQMYVPLGENIFQFQHKETVQGSNPPPEWWLLMTQRKWKILKIG